MKWSIKETKSLRFRHFYFTSNCKILVDVMLNVSLNLFLASSNFSKHGRANILAQIWSKNFLRTFQKHCWLKSVCDKEALTSSRHSHLNWHFTLRYQHIVRNMKFQLIFRNTFSNNVIVLYNYQWGHDYNWNWNICENIIGKFMFQLAHIRDEAFLSNTTLSLSDKGPSWSLEEGNTEKPFFQPILTYQYTSITTRNDVVIKSNLLKLPIHSNCYF